MTKISLFFTIFLFFVSAFGSILDNSGPTDAIGRPNVDLYDSAGNQRGTSATPLYISSLLLPSSLGSKTAALSLAVAIASDQYTALLTQLQMIQVNTASALTDTIATGTITSACTTPLSCAASSYVSVMAQGQYTIGISTSGTFTGSYVAEGQNADGTWTILPMYSNQVGIIGSPYSSTLAGPAQVIVIGGAYSNFRLRCNAFTSGSLSVALDASIAQQGVLAAQLGSWTMGRTWVMNYTTDSVLAVPSDGTKATFSGTAVGLVQGALASDIFCINGSATKTVRVLRFRISETETATTTFNILLVNRSTADSGGTSTAVTAVSHDTANAAATASVKAYTVNPTLGTTVGTVDAAKFFGGAVGANGTELTWQFGDLPAQGFVLRGAAQGLCVNTAGVGQAGASFNIKVLWTEE